MCCEDCEELLTVCAMNGAVVETTECLVVIMWLGLELRASLAAVCGDDECAVV